MHEYTKMRIPHKRYRTNTAPTASSLRFLDLDHFGRYARKFGKCKVRLWVKLFPFLVWIERFREVCTTSSIDNFYLVLSRFITHRKNIEEVAFLDEKFMHEKISKKGVYIWIMMYYRTCSRWCMKLRDSLSQSESGLGDSRALLLTLF